MIVRCTKCDTEFSLDVHTLGPEGMILRCSVCSYMFSVEPIEPQAVTQHPPWQIYSEDRHLFTVANIQELIRLIEDGQVRPEQQLSKTGKHWVRIGDMPEFASIFGAFEGLPKLFRTREFSSASLRIPPPQPPPDQEDGHEDSVVLAASSQQTPLPVPAPEDSPSMSFSQRSKPISSVDEDHLEDDQKPSKSARWGSGAHASATNRPTQEVIRMHEIGETSETEKQPEVVVVKLDRKNSKAWPVVFYALLGVVVGTGIVLAIPAIRQEIWPTTSSAGQPVNPSKEVVRAQPQAAQDFAWAVQARHTLSQEQMERTERRLQKIIGSQQTNPTDKRRASLLQAELLATRSLVLAMAASLDATAMDGLARLQSREDMQWAERLRLELSQASAEDLGPLTLLLAIQSTDDPSKLAHLRNQVPQEELWLWFEAKSLWQNPNAPVADTLIEKLRKPAQPSTLTESLLALAYLRTGELDAARQVIAKILARVPDQPLAQTLTHIVELLPSTSKPEQILPNGEDVKQIQEVLQGGKSSESGRDRPVNPTVSTNDIIDTGCSYIETGKIDQGISLLMRAVDRLDQTPVQLAFCMGRAYAKKGHKASALAYYERVLDQQANHRQALLGAAGIARDLDRTEQAISLYERVLKSDPENAVATAYLLEKGVLRAPEPPKSEQKNDDLLPPSG